MIKSVKNLLLFTICVMVLPSFAQKKTISDPKQNISQGYQVKVKLRSTPKDTLFYLVGYYGNKRVKVDSTTTQKATPNQFVFKSDTSLQSGIYLVVNQRHMQLFEFVVDKSQQISVELDTLNIINTIVVKNSPETQLFYQYLRGLTQRQDSVKEIEKVLDYAQQTQNNALFKSKYVDYLAAINKTEKYTSLFIDTHPKDLIAKVLKMNQEIEMPPLPTLPDGTKDSTWGWQYYKTHYWDNIDITDVRMVRTPVFGNKIKVFFDDLIHQHPDSIMAEIDLFLSKTKPSKEMTRYVLTWLTDHYQQSTVVGHDAVFVHLVEKYFMSGEAPWMSENMIRIYSKRAAQLKSILIGAVIPELVMQDTSGVLLSNYKTGTKYTIMWFWDPDCTHCVVETPKLQAFYQQYKDSLGVEVFAVSLDKDLDRWKKYIRDNNQTWINVGGEKANIDYTMVFDLVATPVVFVFDERKRIIAKNIPVENIKEIILRYEDLIKNRK